jgi:glycerophosphoryl diester phosphodiesterase
MGDPQKPQLLSFWHDGLPALRRVFPSLLVYESIWKFAMWMLLGPLGVTLLHAAIRLGGDVAVANTQLVAFALSPLGFTTIVVLLTVSLALSFIERSGLYVILLNALHQRRTSSWRAFGQTLRASPRIVGVALLQVGLFLIVLLVFGAAIWLAYSLLMSEYDINYYLAEKPTEFLVAVGCALVIGLAGAVVVAYLYVRWAFAVPVALFEGRHFVGALRGSAALVKGWGWRVFGAVLCWEVFRYAFYWLVFLGLKGLNELAVRGLEHAGSGILAWVAGLMILDVLVFVGMAIIETLAFALVITVLYENLHRRREPQPTDRARALLDGSTGPLSRRVVLTSIAVMVVLVVVTAWQTVAVAGRFTQRHPIAVTAHRAGAKDAPENTLAALRGAIAVGADFAEIDVQRTKDGVVVVLHDKDFKRLTGEGKKVWEMSYSEVEKLTYKKKGKGSAEDGKIATLKEFIETAQGKIKLNIELKYAAGHYDSKLAKQVVDMIEEHEFTDQCVITSLDPRALKEVRKLNPQIATGIIVAADIGDITKFDVSFLSLKRKQITAALRLLATAHKLQIHAWDVETRADMEMMLHLGADNLITDDPTLAIEVRQWYENLSDVELILFNFRNWLRS